MKAILNGVMLIVVISASSTLGDELCIKQSFGHDSFVCVCDRYINTYSIKTNAFEDHFPITPSCNNEVVSFQPAL